MPKVGDPAPQFSLSTDGGGRINLSDYVGKKVVLYFYPKDDTPGCTKEACDFRDNIAAIHGKGAEVLGVSPDSTTSHGEFKAKYQLSFPLLADEDHTVAEAYGAWKEKTLYGRTFMGIERTTVLIDEKQKIAGIWTRVQVDGHAQHVIAVLRGEQPAPVPAGETAVKPAAKNEAKAPVAVALPAKLAPRPMAEAKAKKPVAAKPAAKVKAAPAKKADKKVKPAAKKVPAKAKKAPVKAKKVAAKPKAATKTKSKPKSKPKSKK